MRSYTICIELVHPFEQLCGCQSSTLAVAVHCGRIGSGPCRSGEQNVLKYGMIRRQRVVTRTHRDQRTFETSEDNVTLLAPCHAQSPSERHHAEPVKLFPARRRNESQQESQDGAPFGRWVLKHVGPNVSPLGTRAGTALLTLSSLLLARTPIGTPNPKLRRMRHDRPSGRQHGRRWLSRAAVAAEAAAVMAPA
jgi:hypothetical protein